MAGDTVILATLRRGKVYKHFYEGSYLEFKRNVPKAVSEELADQLEDLIDTVGTDEGTAIEVDKFSVERGVPASRLDEDGEPKVRIRTRMVTETVPVRKSPGLRKVPKVTAKVKPGFRRTLPNG